MAGLLALGMAVPVLSQETAKTKGAAARPNPPSQTAPAATKEESKVVATYSLGAITQAEVNRMIGPELARLRKQIYDLESRTIRQMVSERLLRGAALKEGLTRDQYYDKYVTSKIKDPSDAEVEQVMKQYRSQLPKKDEDARKLVRQALRDREKQRLERMLDARLLQGANLKILLEEPRFHVPISPKDPVRGPADAPVTIVEFSDFQCPYCARVQATLHRLMETYPNQVKIVFKNMPGQRHDRARPAAEAALCAGRQGKFWEMHDWLYAHQHTLDDASIEAEAKKLGLDMDAFSTCVSKHETARQVDAGLNEARVLGLNGTPIFFVNGKMIRGARPFQVFDEAVRSELMRLGKVPETAKAAPAAAESTEKTKAEATAAKTGEPAGGTAKPGKK
ncbi:MAG TPA: hypothetical protein ENK19_00790 [Acidobacteria bacterium]|nr:hypothetical protein [Acidobacteriota bacterium]